MGYLSPKNLEKPENAPSTTRRPDGTGLFDIAYAMAYFILPHFAFKDLKKAIDLWVQSPRTCPTFFYLTTCQVKKCESVTEEASQFQAHTGDLGDKHTFYLMQFPPPPPIDLTGWTPEKIAAEKPVLAPYFAAIAVEKATLAAAYFVLGQAPTGGGAAVRQITADGKSLNLATGPKADVGQFLSFVRGRVAAV